MQAGNRKDEQMVWLASRIKLDGHFDITLKKLRKTELVPFAIRIR